MSKKFPWKENGYVYHIGKEQYEEYRSENSRHRYLKETRKNVEIVSLDGLGKKSFEGTDVLRDETINVEDEVIQKIMLEKLAAAKEKLTGDERLLLDLLYEKRKSQSEVAKLIGIPQQTVSYRLQKILGKLRKIMGVKKD